EILEWRFPVRLERFAIRQDSGGPGKTNGGNGIVRELVFTEPVSLSLLTQNRTQGPYGMAGGQAGSPGEQRLAKRNGENMELGATSQESLNAGDRLILKTPGGGGFGKPEK
ncbi:MAG: hydantoinase B/oxoprolinase family protein, partial [Verrucomicrobiota bacterium]|nr:hydantoinase B/oxoprolinase family protein [Verrucomicrobiota bacterium]